jgi:hypothetical protein
MCHPDKEALRVLQNLTSTFSLQCTFCAKDIHLPQGMLVGIEIEVPWKAYFPKLHREFLGEGRTYTDLSWFQKRALTSACRKEEETLLPRLRQTEVCGIVRGKDPYWEFVLPAVGQLGITYQLLEALVCADVLPWGPYSLHLTVSGPLSQARAFVILFLLEALYVRPVRIQSSLVGRGTWSRKGKGGIFRKERHKLQHGSPSAYELRSLELPETLSECRTLFRDFARLAHLLCDMDSPGARHCVREVRELLASHDLPFSEWGNVKEEQRLWEKYWKSLPTLKKEARRIIDMSAPV